MVSHKPKLIPDLFHSDSRAFLLLTRFWFIRERLCMTRLLSMSGIFLGYSFKPRPNSRALGIAGSVMTNGLSVNGCSHSKNQFDGTEQDLLVQRFGLRPL